MENVKYKNYSSEIKSFDEEERTVTHIISSNDVDRSSDVVDVNRIDLKLYQTNPVILWSHQSYIPAIGKSLWQKVEGNKLIAKSQFAKGSELAEELFQLTVIDKVLNNWSIGFTELTDGYYKDGIYFFTDISLHEYSLCNIACNSSCTNLSFIKSLKSDILVEDFMKQYILNQFAEDIRKSKEEYEIIKTELNDFKGSIEFIKNFESKYSNTIDDVITEFQMQKSKKENELLSKNLELEIKRAFLNYK